MGRQRLAGSRRVARCRLSFYVTNYLWPLVHSPSDHKETLSRFNTINKFRLDWRVREEI